LLKTGRHFRFTKKIIVGRNQKEKDIEFRLENIKKQEASLKTKEGQLNLLIAEEKERLQKISSLSAEESHLLLEEWNQTFLPSPVDRCAHELFEHWVTVNPENIAIIFKNDKSRR
jgi:hypothetical protein